MIRKVNLQQGTTERGDKGKGLRTKNAKQFQCQASCQEFGLAHRSRHIPTEALSNNTSARLRSNSAKLCAPAAAASSWPAELAADGHANKPQCFAGFGKQDLPHLNAKLLGFDTGADRPMLTSALFTDLPLLRQLIRVSRPLESSLYDPRQRQRSICRRSC